jgi:hypothetical protein
MRRRRCISSVVSFVFEDARCFRQSVTHVKPGHLCEAVAQVRAAIDRAEIEAVKYRLGRKVTNPSVRQTGDGPPIAGLVQFAAVPQNLISLIRVIARAYSDALISTIKTELCQVNLPFALVAS